METVFPIASQTLRCCRAKLKVKTNQSNKVSSLTDQLAVCRGSWTDVWHTIVKDCRFQTQVRRITARMIDVKAVSNEYTNDVIQDVYLLLAAHIRRNGDLGFQASKGSLRRFLDSLIRNFVREASRKYSNRKEQAKSLPVGELSTMDDQSSVAIEILELRELTSVLPAHTRASAVMFLNGVQIKDIAKRRQISVRTVYRHLNIATDLLRAKWSREPE